MVEMFGHADAVAELIEHSSAFDHELELLLAAHACYAKPSGELYGMEEASNDRIDAAVRVALRNHDWAVPDLLSVLRQAFLDESLADYLKPHRMVRHWAEPCSAEFTAVLAGVRLSSIYGAAQRQLVQLVSKAVMATTAGRSMPLVADSMQRLDWLRVMAEDLWERENASRRDDPRL